MEVNGSAITAALPYRVGRQAAKRAVNVSLKADLVMRARAEVLNLSALAVAAALARIAREKPRRRFPRRAGCTNNTLPSMAVSATRFAPWAMPPSSPAWLDVVRHRVRGVHVPYLLVVQHHMIPATTRLVAPVSPPLPGDVDVLAPRVAVADKEYRARLLDMTAVPVALLGETVASAAADRDAILNAIDLILRSNPVGIPR